MFYQLFLILKYYLYLFLFDLILRHIQNYNYLRIKALNQFGAPARGATVTIKSNKRIHSKTIDAGSGYLCQMEPVAHYGIRQGEKDFKVEIKWTDGSIELFDIDELNKTYEFRQKL